MKKIITEMTNVRRDHFEFEGREYRLATKDEIQRNQGTSARGIWNVFTDGEDFIRIYKADVSEFNLHNAVELFNGREEMTAKEIREYSGLNKTNFCKKYEIPTRTWDSWESGERQPAPYILKLLERVVKEDKR